jgi:predicted RNA-binding Zn-ribbon protein involved in translation (DUF1610 family)
MSIWITISSTLGNIGLIGCFCSTFRLSVVQVAVDVHGHGDHCTTASHMSHAGTVARRNHEVSRMKHYGEKPCPKCGLKRLQQEAEHPHVIYCDNCDFSCEPHELEE